MPACVALISSPASGKARARVRASSRPPCTGPSAKLSSERGCRSGDRASTSSLIPCWRSTQATARAAPPAPQYHRLAAGGCRPPPAMPAKSRSVRIVPDQSPLALHYRVHRAQRRGLGLDLVEQGKTAVLCGTVTLAPATRASRSRATRAARCLRRRGPQAVAFRPGRWRQRLLLAWPGERLCSTGHPIRPTVKRETGMRSYVNRSASPGPRTLLHFFALDAKLLQGGDEAGEAVGDAGHAGHAGLALRPAGRPRPGPSPGGGRRGCGPRRRCSRVGPWTRKPSGRASMAAPRRRNSPAVTAMRSVSFTRSSAASRTSVTPVGLGGEHGQHGQFVNQARDERPGDARRLAGAGPPTPCRPPARRVPRGHAPTSGPRPSLPAHPAPRCAWGSPRPR